ncbi:MAG: hypothetical protein H6598_04755 [Flavobacteriales bacterium]|nr:hypothetical protein [Flavobacteriales bacterium]
MKELDINTVESSELVEQTFKFWFNDNDHIRTPFPEYIQRDLRINATDTFFDWAKNLNPKAKDELNDEIIGEKFEEIMFEEASLLVKTEDERITILYPFLPRIGDKIEDNGIADSTVVDRAIEKRGDDKFLKLMLEKIDSGNRWETSIELPV